VAYDFVDHFGYRLRRGGLRRLDTVAIADHLTLVQVHNRTLDTAAADINSQALHCASYVFAVGYIWLRQQCTTGKVRNANKETGEPRGKNNCATNSIRIAQR
jgi:hypothetical protein